MAPYPYNPAREQYDVIFDALSSAPPMRIVYPGDVPDHKAISARQPGKKSGGPFRVWRYRDRLHHRYDLNIAIDGWAPR